MKERCTIKDVSDLLGISTDTIRLYEKEGLVKPERDPNNGYRYYNALTIQRIMGIMMYRRLNASMREVEQILKAKDLEALADNCEKLRIDNELKMKELQDNNNKLAFMRQHMLAANKSLGELTLCPLERFYSPDIIVSDSNNFHEGILEAINNEYFSYGNECFIMQSDDDGNITGSKHMYAIREPMMHLSPLKEQIASIPYYEEELGVHTVVGIENSTYTKDVFVKMQNFAKENGFTPKNYIYSFYVISLGDEGHPVNYFELFLPLHKKG